MSDLFLSLPLAATDDAGFASSIFLGVLMGLRVAVGIGLVIFVHELGHFLAAKMFGVKVEKFYVGFDVPIKIGPLKFPRTLGKFTYGETEYGIGVIPLGGYVKMLGQDDDPRRAEEESQRIRVTQGDEDSEPQLDPRSYPAKPVWQRMVIISAGVVMNVITGVLFAAIAFGLGVTYQPAVIGGVIGGGPAWQVGVEPGGRVISVGDFSPERGMHYSEMQFEIGTTAISSPDEPIDMTIQYDDGPRQLKLPTIPAADGKRRLVGVFPTFSPKLDVNPYFYQAESVASRVFTKEDAGAEIVAFGTHSVNTNAIDPTTPLLDYLHKHASESIELKLRRSDGTPRTVTLPPQSLKTLGLRFAIGPITALVDNGPAKKNGLQVGDVITQLDGNSDIDAYSLAIALVGRKTPVQLKARRGTDDGAIELDVTLDPSQMLQTLSPTQNNGAVLAVNALGIAYTVLPSVVLADRASFSEATATSSESESAISSIAEDEFQSGDVVKKITVQFPGGKLPPSLSDASYASIVSKLAKGVELDESTTIVDFVDWLQMMPVGTTFDILAVRPAGGRVIQITRSVTESELVWFDRGIGFAPTEAIQKATSFGEAMSLGMRRGVWDLSAVFRSLKMIGQGNVGAKDIGGPIRIAQAAWYQANRGISPLLLFLTMLSMNLAILNFLPIPALDGGHMMFLIAEAVRGRRVDEQWEMRLTMLGVLALLALMAFVIFNDIYQGLM